VAPWPGEVDIVSTEKSVWEEVARAIVAADDVSDGTGNRQHPRDPVVAGRMRVLRYRRGHGIWYCLAQRNPDIEVSRFDWEETS
jgi:hypothetical protein